MKNIILALIIVTQALAFDTQDTIKTSPNSYTVINYINSKYNNTMINVSKDYYKNDVLVSNTLLWGDSINLKIVDSITTVNYKGYHYVFTWRGGNINSQSLYYDSIVEFNVENDKRTVLKKSSETNIVKFNSYEIRMFCGRIVEIYYLDSVKVYSVFTETNCADSTDDSNDSIPKYLQPIG